MNVVLKYSKSNSFCTTSTLLYVYFVFNNHCLPFIIITSLELCSSHVITAPSFSATVTNFFFVDLANGRQY
jgi:hypothetical protein